MDFIEEERDRINFSEDGFLISAPRRWSSDGYDFSSVLSLEYLRRAFEDSVYNCLKGIHYCKHLTHTHRDKPNKIKIFTSANYLNDDDISKIDFAMYRTLIAVGVDFSYEPNPKEATIVFHTGDLKYIRYSMRKNGDDYGLYHLSAKMKNSKHSLDGHGYCYLSHKGYRDGQLRLYFNKKALDTCFPREVMGLIGFSATGVPFPSLLSLSTPYQGATFADVFFVRLLKHPNFPRTLNLLDFREFWDAGAQSIRKSVLLVDQNND